MSLHYPRSTLSPNPEGKNFEWFVANEKNDKLPLPSLTEDDRGLPVLSK